VTSTSSYSFRAFWLFNYIDFWQFVIRRRDGLILEVPRVMDILGRNNIQPAWLRDEPSLPLHPSSHRYPARHDNTPQDVAAVAALTSGKDLPG
jgi:hypothetical protein